MAELNSSPEKTGGRTPRKRLNARVDLTAMVDLAFLLITFFMLTTSLQKDKAAKVYVPDKNLKGDYFGDPESRTMTICMGKNNEVVSWIGMAESPLTQPKADGFDKNGLRKTLIDNAKSILAKTGKSMLVIIKPSDHSVYSNLVSTLDEVNITGMPGYSITDITPKDVELMKQRGAY